VVRKPVVRKEAPAAKDVRALAEEAAASRDST